MSRDNKQAGLVSIMVTMVLMIVITLIVIGFAQISRRNQRQALDRQLSTQAFYAAETGINDATNVIKQAISTGTVVGAKTDCAPGAGPVYGTLPSPTLNSTANVAYTCLLVDPSPTSLEYGTIKNTSTIIPLHAVSGTFANLKLSWKTPLSTDTPTAGCPGNAGATGVLPQSWSCGYGIVRFDLVPTSGSLSIGSLQSFMTSFMVPMTAAGSTTMAYATGTTGTNRTPVTCDNTNCTMTITGLSDSRYAMRVSSIYKDARQFKITPTDAGGNPIKLADAQAVVDATGKAQDVLRRIQVRLPLTATTTNLLPDNALASNEAVCKRFRVMDGYYANDAQNVAPGVSPSNPLCNLPN